MLHHLGVTPQQSHRATPPLRPPPIQTSLQGVNLRSITGNSKYGKSQSPLTLARKARSKASQEIVMATSTPSPASPARSDPLSVPCSPTYYTDVAVHSKSQDDEGMPSYSLDGIQMKLSSASLLSPTLSSYHVSLPSQNSNNGRNFPWAMQEPKKKAQGWVNLQHTFDHSLLADETIKNFIDSGRHKLLGRSRSYSESATSLSTSVSQWKRKPLSRLVAKQRVGKCTNLLDPIIDCAQEKELEAAPVQRGRTSSWDIVASNCEFSNFSQDQILEGECRPMCESIKEIESDGMDDGHNKSCSASVSFSVLRGQTEGNFTLSQSDVGNLQYSDLEEQCQRALLEKIQSSSTQSIGRGDRIFVVVSATEAMRLRLIRFKSTEASCNLALLEPWTTSISTTMQELLIKDSFRQACHKERKVRLVVLERGQSLPSHICASKNFWDGWANLPLTADKCRLLSILIQSGAAPVVPSRSISSKGASIRVSNLLSRPSLTVETSWHTHSRLANEDSKDNSPHPVNFVTKVERIQEEQYDSHSSPSCSLLPFQSSHFSSETSPEERTKNSLWVAKMPLLPAKRRKRGVRMPLLTGTALALRASNVSCFKNDTISPRVTSVMIHTRRERRVSVHPSTPSKTSSTLWRKKRRDMLIDTFNSPKTGFGSSFKRSNQALKRAAGYFGSRASFSVKTSQPPTPTTASMSLAEVCSYLPESSVENLLFCNEIQAPGDSVDWKNTIAEYTVKQDEKEVIAGKSIERASLNSKRKGWLGNGSCVPSIRESCDLEDEEQEIEIRPATERQTIILEDTFGKKGIMEELAEELYEPPRQVPSRKDSISSLLKSTLSSLTVSNSPQKIRPFKQSNTRSTLRKQMNKLTRSKSDDWSSRPELLPGSKRESLDATSMSFYSTSSFDGPDLMPLTGGTTVDNSPCLTEGSPVLHLTLPDNKVLSPLDRINSNSIQVPRPPRKRQSGMFQLQSISTYGSLYRSQSLSMKSEDWMCSNEDLEPEVRDCVSSLSGRIGDGRSLHFEVRNVKNIDWKNLKKDQQLQNSLSIDSTVTTNLSGRGINPGSAPLLQQCSSPD